MTEILVAVVVAQLLTNSSFAQSYCDQVRQAVATYYLGTVIMTLWALPDRRGPFWRGPYRL
jgi:hypothetical protein